MLVFHWFSLSLGEQITSPLVFVVNWVAGGGGVQHVVFSLVVVRFW